MMNQEKREGLSIIGASCIERMQTGGVNTNANAKKTEYALKKEQCQKRVQNWPNTLEAVRMKKEEKQFLQFERNEMRLRARDEEESAIRQKEREAELKRANNQIFESDNRVVQMKSKLLLSEAMQVREMQKEVKQRQMQMEREKEEEYLQNQKNTLRVYDQKKEEKKREEVNKKTQFQIAIKQQHQEVITRHVKEYQMDLIEGQLTKNRNQEAQVVQEKKDRIRRNKKIDMVEGYTEEGLRRQVRTEQDRLNEVQQQVQTNNWVTRKEKIVKMKQDRDTQMAQKRQNRIDHIFNSNQEVIQNQQVNYDTLINKHQEEMEHKYHHQQNTKLNKQQKLKYDTQMFNQKNISVKQIQKTQQKQEDRNYQQFWKEKNVQIAEEEEENRQRVLRQNKQLQREQQEQAQEKQREREQLILEEIDECNVAKTNNQMEDKHYKNWAEKAINEWDSNGKNIKPMLLTLQKQMQAL